MHWDGCVNVRDLGGQPIEGGGRTRLGAVVRADDLGRLTSSGWAELLRYGVGRIVDLRCAGETTGDVPRPGDVEVVRIPVLEEQEVSACLLREFPAGGDRLFRFYRWALATYRENFVRAIAAVAEAPDGRPVVVHCRAGKDRTGLVAALLLALAGVPDDAIAADYALSETCVASVEPWVAAGMTEDERAIRRCYARSPAASMRRTLAEIQGRHGGAEGYLLGGGADDAVIARVRARLAGDAGSDGGR